MKKPAFILLFLFLGIFFTTKIQAKGPVTVEIETQFKTIKEATMAAKTALMNQKFIPNGPVQEGQFTATRTTGSKADYYTADVVVEDRSGKIVVTITFIKSGTGLLKLQKVADQIKLDLGGSTSSGSKQVEPKIETNSGKSLVLTANDKEIKCQKFGKMKKGGIAMIIGGGVLIGSGIIFQSINSSSAVLYNLGEAMVPLGALALGGGITLVVIGGKKQKQYCSLALNVKGTNLGLALNF